MVKSPAAAESNSHETKYKGVRKRKWGKYVSEIRLPNSRERIWLGSFDSAKKAARAFDAALFCLRGHSASFNFPDNPPNISNGRSLTPAQIQVAAHQFANSEQAAAGTTTYSSFSSSSDSETEPFPDSPSTTTDHLGNGAVHESESSDPSIVNLFATMGPFDDSYNNNMMNIHDPAANQFYEIYPGFDDLRNNFLFDPPPPALPSPVNDYSFQDHYNSSSEYGGGGSSSSNGFNLWNF